MNAPLPPVITVTFNPAIDETIALDALLPGTVHRARAVRFDPGGKGVIVAGCLADWGQRVVATGLLGEDNDAPFTDLFAAKGIEDRFCRFSGPTRVNVKLVDPRDTTDINLPGADLAPEQMHRARDAVLALASSGAIVVLAGSLPADFPDDTYAHCIAELTARQVRVVLDTSGPPLTAALQAAAGALPHAIKPNRTELEAWAQRALPTHADLISASRDLLTRGVALVAVSLGSEGAIFVTREAALHASLPAMRPASTVGAGDAMVAGMVAGINSGAPIENIARLATAFAYTKLGQIGANLGDPEHVRSQAAHVVIERLN